MTRITSWGSLYYAFFVLTPAITRDTGWSTNAITAAFSTALLVCALAGIPVGRLLDRHGPHAVMTTGSAMAVAELVAIALAPNLPLFFAAWILAGTTMAATFYQPPLRRPHPLAPARPHPRTHHPHPRRRTRLHRLRPP